MEVLKIFKFQSRVQFGTSYFCCHNNTDNIKYEKNSSYEHINSDKNVVSEINVYKSSSMAQDITNICLTHLFKHLVHHSIILNQGATFNFLHVNDTHILSFASSVSILLVFTKM